MLVYFSYLVISMGKDIFFLILVIWTKANLKSLYLHLDKEITNNCPLELQTVCVYCQTSQKKIYYRKDCARTMNFKL